MYKKVDMLENIFFIIIMYINVCGKWKSDEIKCFYMYKVVKRYCMVGS